MNHCIYPILEAQGLCTQAFNFKITIKKASGMACKDSDPGGHIPLGMGNNMQGAGRRHSEEEQDSALARFGGLLGLRAAGSMLGER
jgi:hypothetical protein